MARQPGPSKGRGGAITRRLTGAPPHRRLGMSRRVADWRRARSSTRDRSPAAACRDGQQLRDSIHSRIRQCLAITRPPVTRQPGPSKGRGGADNTAASPAPPRRRVGMSRRVADWRMARSSTRDRSRAAACPNGRQLRDSIHAGILPVPCHHPATNDTPTSSFQGRGRSRDTATTLVRHFVDESGSVVASWIGGGREAPRGIVPEQRRAGMGGSFATAPTHASASALPSHDHQ